jgi:hypothetical protein
MIPLMVATSYVNSLLFAFSQAYLFQNAWWLDRGFWGLLSWSFEVGSMAAAASVVGYVGGRSLAAKLGAGYDAMVNHHRLAYEAISVTVAIGIFAAVTLA